MKFILTYIKARRERKLRERCVKYAVEVLRNSGYNTDTTRLLAHRFFEYITTGKYQS